MILLRREQKKLGKKGKLLLTFSFRECDFFSHRKKALNSETMNAVLHSSRHMWKFRIGRRQWSHTCQTCSEKE